MSSFQTFEAPPDRFEGDPETRPAQKYSGLAIAGLVLSLIACCPFIGLVGPLLGLISLLMILGSPRLKGAWISILAIVIGLVLQAAVLIGGWQMTAPMFAIINRGPDLVVAPAEAGDYDAVRARFHGAAANVTDAELDAFVAEYRLRYGAAGPWIAGGQFVPDPSGAPLARHSGTITAEDGTVYTVEFVFLYADESTGDPWVFKLESMRIQDPDRGDLTFPSAAGASGANADPTQSIQDVIDAAAADAARRAAEAAGDSGDGEQ